MRPTIFISDDLAAVIKYHCEKERLSIAGYMTNTVYDDLVTKYPELMKGVKKEVATFRKKQ